MSDIKIKVLLIEEDEDAAADIQAMLNGSEHPRFQVTRARDLVSGMELLTEEEYHAVILDSAVCGDLAAKAVTTIQTVAAEPAVILLASPDQESNTTRGIFAGAVEYFVLDEFDPAEFKLRLRRTIAKHWIQRQFEPARYAGAAVPPVAGID